MVHENASINALMQKKTMHGTVHRSYQRWCSSFHLFSQACLDFVENEHPVTSVWMKTNTQPEKLWKTLNKQNTDDPEKYAEKFKTQIEHIVKR